MNLVITWDHYNAKQHCIYLYVAYKFQRGPLKILYMFVLCKGSINIKEESMLSHE